MRKQKFRIDFELKQIDKEVQIVDLLKTMENGIISKKLAEELKQLMGFRHFFRHAYGFMLNKENIEPLVFNMRQLFEEFRSEIG